MVRGNCVACGVFLRGKKNHVGSKYFWDDFVHWMSENHEGKLYAKDDLMCGKCHTKVSYNAHECVVLLG